MNKIELNNDYITKIINGKSDILKLKYQEVNDDNEISVIIEDQAGEFFEGKVTKTDKGYVIIGDTEFDRVYPILDSKTKEIVKIKRSEEHPPG